MQSKAVDILNYIIEKVSMKNVSFMTSVKLVKYSNHYFDSIPIGKCITGTYSMNDNYIIVYQAFNEKIATYACKHNKFIGCPVYNPTRMTWIKPNFLWMMYRSGWSFKDKNQTNILAIYLRLDPCFMNMIQHCVISQYNEILPYSRKEHNRRIKSKSRVVCQWDPHHRSNGSKVEFKRAIQLGMKGEYLDNFHKNIIKIEDITHFVRKQHSNMMNNIEYYVPLETELKITDKNISKNLCLGTE